jgi:hypothetical protein
MKFCVSCVGWVQIKSKSSIEFSTLTCSTPAIAQVFVAGMTAVAVEYSKSGTVLPAMLAAGVANGLAALLCFPLSWADKTDQTTRLRGDGVGSGFVAVK